MYISWWKPQYTLFRVYLDARLASSTSKSAESGNDEAFVDYWISERHSGLNTCGV